MSDINVILREIESISRLAEKYTEGKVDIPDNWTAVNLRSVLSRDDNMALLDKYLVLARQYMDSDQAKTDPSDRSVNGDGLYQFEMKLSAKFRFKSRDLDRLITVSQRASDSQKIAHDSGELVAQLEQEILELRDVVELSRKEQRHEKKRMKQVKRWRIWLTAHGTTLTLGNIALALPSVGLAAPVAIASMAIGTTAVGAAAFNDLSLMKSIPKIVRTSKKGKD